MSARATQRSSAAPLNPLLTGSSEYPFVTLDRKRRERIPPGVKAIDFSIGDPRERTPAFIREALKTHVPEVSSYPSVAGLPELRAACAGWLRRRFGVSLDPDTEILPVNGSKEGVFLLALAIMGGAGERDAILIPSPAYPVYENSARFAGATVVRTRLTSDHHWRFDPDEVPTEIWDRVAILWLNSPHNPTGAVLPREVLASAAERARRAGFWLASDEAYADIYFDEPPHSVLESGTDNVLAFHTLSKRSAMTGYRSGFMAGDRRLIEVLRRFRPNVGVATPEFIQRAAIAAWNDDEHPHEQRRLYADKRRLFLVAFKRLGLEVEASTASFYLWVKAPSADDVAWVERLMELGLVATPGSYLGEGGEGYVRWAMVPTMEECVEAIARLEQLNPRAGR